MILGAEPKNQVIWTIHCKVMAPNLQICPNMGKIDEKRPFLSRPSVNYFKNSLKSFVIMLLTAPGVKLPSYRKNGFKASWWRCGLVVLCMCNYFKAWIFHDKDPPSYFFLYLHVQSFQTMQQNLIKGPVPS